MPRVKVSKKVLWQAIRKHCLECCGGSYKEVETCSGGHSAEGNPLGSYRCELFPYRLGRIEGSNYLLKSQNMPPTLTKKAPNTRSEGLVRDNPLIPPVSGINTLCKEGGENE